MCGGHTGDIALVADRNRVTGSIGVDAVAGHVRHPEPGTAVANVPDLGLGELGLLQDGYPPPKKKTKKNIKKRWYA